MLSVIKDWRTESIIYTDSCRFEYRNFDGADIIFFYYTAMKHHTFSIVL